MESKTIFWNVDTQYDFMRKEGALYVVQAELIEPNLERLTRYARKNNIFMVNTADWHLPGSKEISPEPDFKTTFPPHCLIGTLGARYVPATQPQNYAVVDWRFELDEAEVRRRKEIVLYKDHFDIFQGNPHTEKVLELVKPTTAVVYGVATNVCVNYAVLGLRNKGIETLGVTDAIKELPGLPLEEVLTLWKDTGAKLVDTQQVINLIGGK